MRIRVVLTLDYGMEEPWGIDEAIEELKLEHPIADITIEDYYELGEGEKYELKT